MQELGTLPDVSSSNYLMELDSKNCQLTDPNLVKLPSSRSIQIPTGEYCTDVQIEEANEADGIVEEPALPVRIWWKNIVDSMRVTTGWLSQPDGSQSSYLIKEKSEDRRTFLSS